MKKLLLSLLVGTFLAGCGGEERKKGRDAKATLEDDEITAVLERNMVAANQEDIDEYMATIHTQSPLYVSTSNMATELWRMYDLEIELRNLKVISRTERKARVKFTLTTRKIRGPSFADNKVDGIHVMRKEDGAWKIYQSEMNDVEYLN